MFLYKNFGLRKVMEKKEKASLQFFNNEKEKFEFLRQFEGAREEVEVKEFSGTEEFFTEEMRLKMSREIVYQILLDRNGFRKKYSRLARRHNLPLLLM